MSNTQYCMYNMYAESHTLGMPYSGILIIAQLEMVVEQLAFQAQDFPHATLGVGHSSLLLLHIVRPWSQQH